MTYTKQNFKDGNPLYAAQLNYIEDGIVKNNFIVNIFEDDDYNLTMDTTYEELYRAYSEGAAIRIIYDNLVFLNMVSLDGNDQLHSWLKLPDRPYTIVLIFSSDNSIFTFTSHSNPLDLYEAANGEIPMISAVNADSGAPTHWTSVSKSQIVDDVLAALPTWTGGSY